MEALILCRTLQYLSIGLLAPHRSTNKKENMNWNEYLVAQQKKKKKTVYHMDDTRKDLNSSTNNKLKPGQTGNLLRIKQNKKSKSAKKTQHSEPKWKMLMKRMATPMEIGFSPVLIRVSFFFEARGYQVTWSKGENLWGWGVGFMEFLCLGWAAKNKANLMGWAGALPSSPPPLMASKVLRAINCAVWSC